MQDDTCCSWQQRARKGCMLVILLFMAHMQRISLLSLISAHQGQSSRVQLFDGQVLQQTQLASLAQLCLPVLNSSASTSLPGDRPLIAAAPPALLPAALPPVAVPPLRPAAAAADHRCREGRLMCRRCSSTRTPCGCPHRLLMRG
jgi:hypothetical protein